MTLPPSEGVNPGSHDLDLLTTPALVELLVREQRGAVEAVLSQSASIARVVDTIAARIASGGSLHYVGAGSSGRIAALDAAEMPPTFGTVPSTVRAHLAGGHAALLEAVEGAEDDAAAGERAAREHVAAADAAIGISASGGAAFAIAAIETARALGAYTVALVNADGCALERAAHDAIVLRTGAEALSGSTRMKAGTAQKIALNAISTGVMVRLGKVYDNLMVDVAATNRKLRARSLRLVRELGGVDEARARELLAQAEGSVKRAVVMARRGVDASVAAALLEQHRGSLRALL